MRAYLACSTLAIVLLAVTGRAQESGTPEDPARAIGKAVEKQLRLEVESRLKSKELATIAWGGYLAAQHRVAGVVPALRRALRELPQGQHRRYAAQALLDALIVHGAQVPFDEFAAVAKGMNEGAAVVLSGMDPLACREFLLGLYESHQTKRLSRWLAAGNLLARIKDREFGRRLVEGLEYELDLSVTTPGHPVGFGVGGAFGGRFGDGRLTTPTGFPPTVTYTLRADPKPGDVLFAEGTQPVYYRRDVHHERKIGVGYSEFIRLRGRQQTRVDWLGAMLQQSFGKLPREQSKMVTWSDAEAFVADVAKHKAAIVSKHDRIVGKAIGSGWFAQSERQALAARVAIKCSDQRADKSVALPKVE